MKSGKSAALISRLAQYDYANLCIQVFYPAVDLRANVGEIDSRLGLRTAAQPVHKPAEVLAAVKPGCDVVAIDEAELFADAAGMVEVVRTLIARGVVVLVAGLDLDFAERPFGAMATLCALADRVEKLTAICSECGSAFATRTQRLVNGRPASLKDPAVLIEGSDDAVVYQARCHFCYERPR
jgi:thymidine kinase